MVGRGSNGSVKSEGGNKHLISALTRSGAAVTVHMQTKETDRINYGIYIEMSNDESVSGISSNSSRKLQTLCILTRHFARALRTRWMNEEGNASSSMAGKLRALITFFASFSPSASITMVGSVQVGNGVSYAQTPIMCMHIYVKHHHAAVIW